MVTFLDAQAPPKWANNWINQLKCNVLQLGDPNPNPHRVPTPHSPHLALDVPCFGGSQWLVLAEGRCVAR